MPQRAITAVVTVVAALALACPSASALAAGTALLRVVHASPDAFAVTVTVDGRPLISALRFKDATPYQTVAAGAHRVQVSAANVAGARPLIDTTLTLEDGQAYTVVAADVQTKMTAVVLTDTLAAAPANQAFVRLVHVSPDAPPVADIAVAGGPVVFSHVAFKAATAYLPVAPSTYRFDVQPAGATQAVATTNALTLEKDHSYSVFAMGLLADGTFQAILVPDNARAGGVAQPPPSGGGGGADRRPWTASAVVVGGFLLSLGLVMVRGRRLSAARLGRDAKRG